MEPIDCPPNRDSLANGAPPLLQVVGDGDTLSGPGSGPRLLTRDPDQETNDLTKALRWCATHRPGMPRRGGSAAEARWISRHRSET